MQRGTQRYSIPNGLNKEAMDRAPRRSDQRRNRYLRKRTSGSMPIINTTIPTPSAPSSSVIPFSVIDSGSSINITGTTKAYMHQ